MMFLLSTQQWTLILLAVCVVPIAVLIILAIVLRIKNSVKKRTVESDEVDSEQRLVFLEAFGGEDNFINATQERIKVIVKVKDPELIQGEKLQELGAKGVLIVGNEIRCSFGDRAEYVYKTLSSDKSNELKDENEDNKNE